MKQLVYPFCEGDCGRLISSCMGKTPCSLMAFKRHAGLSALWGAAAGWPLGRA